MKKGLSARLRQVFGIGTADESFFEELEDSLVEADLGGTVAMEVSQLLRLRARKEQLNGDQALRQALHDILLQYVTAVDLSPDPARMNVYLVLGVNGVGKTTTIAKLAHHFEADCGVSGTVLAAGDTFRAAAVEQLAVHAQRLGVRIVRQAQGADPGAVIYDALQSASNRGERIVLADTAGRMHNKANLIAELQKIDRIVAGRAADCNYRRLLVIDATTGQNGLRQAETFHEAVGVDAAVLTKYDSTAKGGIVVPICKTLGIPFSYISDGERYSDIRRFDTRAYIDDLVGL
ncbi:MAG: signal recognition particle-docking protein FtsY [Spirochaetaceae bacterium]|nr:MAG: signal recognition particle-docking protein FtsY [Spirochaetaceae bacterium]